MSLRHVLDALSVRLYGRTLGEAHAAQECLHCGKPVRPDEMTTEDATEYMLSGFCPACFAKTVPADE